MKIPIILLHPPFFTCVGSHNSRAPLELAYASRFLYDAGIEHLVLNADYRDINSYLPWRKLFENHEYWKAAVDGQSPLLDTCTEMVLQFNPDVVVIAAGDSCLPTKDFGSPYIAAHISERLRKYKVKTIGLGPMFLKDTEPFEPYFDGFFTSLINRSIVDVVLGERPDVITGSPAGVEPYFGAMYPEGQNSNYVLSAFGCDGTCSFCMSPIVTGGQVVFQPTGFFIRELLGRSAMLQTNKLYIADMNFPLNLRRMKFIAESLDGAGLDLTVEARTDSLNEAKLAAMKQMGVKTVKIGLEAINDVTLKKINKGQSIKKEEKAIRLLRQYGMNIVGYLQFGDFYESEDAMWLTIVRAGDLDVDYYVINVSAYQTLDWERRYDSHFSLISARQQGIPDHIIWAALDLLEGKSNPTVEGIK